MKVSDIMTREVIAVTPDTSVSEIAKLMVGKDISGVPVVVDGRVVGIITETDLVARNAYLHFPTFVQILDARIYLQSPRHFEEELRRMLGTTAADVMTKEVKTVKPDADVAEVATLMFEKHVNPVPVVKNGKLVGIVSRADVIRLLVQQETG
ncbi:MAG: CBS domain-containing protein [Chloroflexi bacterium]|nr:CBS domain-containing protein [Chloroflexota bacterium]MDA8188691.1 CBS domain-containing protein [Dehalococcoidales bacterium]